MEKNTEHPTGGRSGSIRAAGTMVGARTVKQTGFITARLNKRQQMPHWKKLTTMAKHDFTNCKEVTVVYTNYRTPPYCGTAEVDRVTRDWVYIKRFDKNWQEFRFSTKDLHGEEQCLAEKGRYKFQPSNTYRLFLTICDAYHFMEKLRTVEEVKIAVSRFDGDTPEGLVNDIYATLKHHEATQG